MDRVTMHALMEAVIENVADGMKEFILKETKLGRGPWTLKELLEGTRRLRPELAESVEIMMPGADKMDKKYVAGPEALKAVFTD